MNSFILFSFLLTGVLCQDLDESSELDDVVFVFPAGVSLCSHQLASMYSEHNPLFKLKRFGVNTIWRYAEVPIRRATSSTIVTGFQRWWNGNVCALIGRLVRILGARNTIIIQCGSIIGPNSRYVSSPFCINQALYVRFTDRVERHKS